MIYKNNKGLAIVLVLSLKMKLFSIMTSQNLNTANDIQLKNETGEWDKHRRPCNKNEKVKKFYENIITKV